MPPFLSAIFSPIGRWLLVAGAVMLAIATFGASQRRAGRQQEQARQQAATINAAETRINVEDAVRRTGAGSADRLRDEWGRD